MFDLVITVENGKLFDRLAKSIHSSAVRNGLNKAANFWRKKYAPLHFKPGAEARYGYRRRTETYKRRKLRKQGHQLPLVFTGALREAVTKGKVRRQKTSPTSIDLILRLPTSRGADYARYNPNLPPGQIIREVTATTDEERNAMVAEYGKHYGKKLLRDLKKHRSVAEWKAR